MTITLVGTAGATADTGSPTLTLPTGISFGDAVGVVGICANSVTLTPPAGWSTRSGFPQDGGSARFYAFTKDSVTQSDASSQHTFTLSATSKTILVCFALTSGNGFPADWTDDLTFQGHTTTGTTYTAPASVSTVAGTFGVAVFGTRGTGPFSDWAAAAGLVERQDLTRSGGGATTLHLCDSAGSVGGSATTWGPFSESNLSTSNGGGLTWLVKENATGGGGGGGGGGGLLYPKLGLWHQGPGSWRADQDSFEQTYGAFQGHWSEYYVPGAVPIAADVEQAFNDGKNIHIYWKSYDTSWGDTAAGGYDTEADAFAADVVALCAGTGRKLWVTLHHEPEDDYINHGSGGTGWTAANYRGMWQQVRARFDAGGASQYVTWVCVFQNSHSHPAEMITLWGDDSVMDGLVDIVSQQDYVPISNPDPAGRIVTRWMEDLEWARTNESSGRHWGYLSKPQAFTETGLLGGATTATQRAQVCDGIRGMLGDLGSRNVAEIRWFSSGNNVIEAPPSTDGVAFQALKAATEQGQQQPPVVVAGVALARDGATATSTSVPFVLPTGWAQGDLAIVWLSTNSIPTMSTVPAGWVLEESLVNGTSQVGWRFSKVLAAGEPDPTWVISQSVRPSGVMVLLRGVDGATPEHAEASLTATASSTSHAAAAVTTTAPAAFVLTAWLFRWSDGTGGTPSGSVYGTPPGTHTTAATVSVNSGANAGAGVLVASLNTNPVAAGSYGAYTATVPVASNGICGQVAFLPGTTPPPQPDTKLGQGALALAFAGVASGATTSPATGLVPDTRVLVAFSTQPMNPVPAWTTLPTAGTGRVIAPLQVTHGRSDEFADVSPGTLAGALDNADGRYTLGKTGGPHGTGVKVGRRARLEIVYGSGAPAMHAALTVHPDQTTTAVNTELDHIVASGASMLWVTAAMNWLYSTGSGGDAAALAKFDTVINGASSRSLPVALQLHGMPTWITNNSGHTADPWHGPDTAGERSDWVGIVHNLINRYGASKIHYAEIWNEPDLTEFWVQGPSAADYVRLLQAAYVDIKASWPTINVVGFNLGRNHGGFLETCYTQIDTIFTHATAAANSHYFDRLGIHPYCGNSTSGYDPNDTSHADETTSFGWLDPDYLGYRRLRDAIATHEGAAKDLAFGEFGYTTDAGWFSVTDATRATYLASAINLARADGYVDYLHPYLHDLSGLFSVGGFNIHNTTTETAFTEAAAALRSGGVHSRFDGHVNSWPVEWPVGGGQVAFSALSATDRLKRLGQIGELRSMLEEEILRDGPACYYPLAEGDGATAAGSVTLTPQASAVDAPFGTGGGAVTFGQGTGPGTDSLTAAVFTPQSQTSGRFLRANPVAVNASGGQVTLECWFATTAAPTPNAMAMAALTTGPGDDAVILGIWSTGQVQAFVVGDGVSAFGNLSPATYNDGHTHHAAVTLTRSGSTVTVRLYVDGIQRQTGTYDAAPFGTFSQLDIGGYHVSGPFAPYSGTLSHVAAHPTALTAARIQTHHQAGATGLVGERTDQRIARVADWIGLPTVDRALDVGDKTMGPQTTTGKQPLEVMAEAARVEQGVLFCNGSGKLTFHRLSRRYNRTSPDLTLDCAAGHITVPLPLPGDDFGLVNDMEATRPGGATQRARNQTSIDDYGLYRDSLEIPAASDNDAQAVANWRTGNYGDPRTRVPNLTVNLAKLHTVSGGPALVAAILGLEISSLVRLVNLPTQAPGTSVDVFVEGWQETIDPAGGWTIELNCSPADHYTVAQLGLTATVTLPTARVAL